MNKQGRTGKEEEKENKEESEEKEYKKQECKEVNEKHNEEKECIKKEHEEKPKEKQGFDELKDTLQRLQAEFENYKKREEIQKKQFLEYANASLTEKFLPVLDSMDKAAEHNAKEIELIRKQFFDVMKAQGLEEINALGKQFDPSIHDCVSYEENKEKENGIILEEFLKGYLFKGKLLRASKVKVNKKTFSFEKRKSLQKENEKLKE
ncbi:MAG: nucleotide exchange factor GrpE [Candidatus Diapherotrites archaeon]